MSNQLQKQHIIQGVEKRNPFIIFAIVDEDYNMYIHKNGEVERIADIPEHFDRMDTMSQFGEFNIDKLEYEAYGNKGVPHKFTRVYEDRHEETLDKKKIKNSFTRFYDWDRLENNLRNHESFKKVSVFISGGSRLLKRMVPMADKVFITRVMNNVIDENTEVLDKFPVEEFKKYFTKRQILESDISHALKSTDGGAIPSDREITMLSEYIRQSKRVQKAKPKATAAILPEYRFEIFSK